MDGRLSTPRLSVKFMGQWYLNSNFRWVYLKTRGKTRQFSLKLVFRNTKVALFCIISKLNEECELRSFEKFTGKFANPPRIFQVKMDASSTWTFSNLSELHSLFGWEEYLVLSGVLFVSVLIGIDEYMNIVSILHSMVMYNRASHFD